MRNPFYNMIVTITPTAITINGPTNSTATYTIPCSDTSYTDYYVTYNYSYYIPDAVIEPYVCYFYNERKYKNHINRNNNYKYIIYNKISYKRRILKCNKQLYIKCKRNKKV